MAMASAMKSLALTLGFDLAGVTQAVAGPRSRFLSEWLARGYGGSPEGPLGYVARRAALRQSPGS